jgi:hypothetical protein
LTVLKVPTLALATLLAVALGRGIAIAQTTVDTVPTRVQTGLTIRDASNKKWHTSAADKVYLSSCAVVQREFGIGHELRPAVTLIVGAEKDVLDFDRREIRLTKWDPYLFAQGVVVLAFEDLLPKKEVLSVAKRAVSWADSTIDAKEETK